MMLDVKNYLKHVLISILMFNIYITRAQDVATTLETIILETTTEFVTIITDIPQSDVEMAMNHDVGKFTTMVYNYINSQNSLPKDNERCYDDYTKCLITQSVATPVCTVNYPYRWPRGFSWYNSYCDAYFENCMRKKRFWRIVDVGICKQDPLHYFHIEKTRKLLK